MRISQCTRLLAAFLVALALQVNAEDVSPAVEFEAPGDRPVAEEQLEPSATVARTGADLMDLESSSIRGNQELPKVLYIVPWKDPGLGELVGKPVNSLVDEVIAPVDREVFLRQTMYFDQLYADPENASD